MAIPQQTNRFYEFGPFRIDRAERMLLRKGEVVPLTPKQFDILLVLVENRGHVVEKGRVMQEIWPDTAVEEGNLTTNISMLRKALEEGTNGQRYIQTLARRGYRFVGQVSELTGHGLGISQEQSRSDKVIGQEEEEANRESAKQRVGETEPIAEFRRLGVRALPFKALAVLVVALALATIGYVKFLRGSPPLPRSEVKSLVVLPLENLSGDPAQEYFADGITDALIGELARIGELRVISRTSAMHYKGMRKALPEIARELKVDAVVEGTVVRSGDRVAIRAQLIHAQTDRHLWAENYERDISNVLSLQREVAHTIAREIKIQTTSVEQTRLANIRPVNRKAFDNYLQGRYLYWNKRTEEGLSKAIEYFESAVKEDPAFAPAYAGLADCHNARGSVNIGGIPPTEARLRGEDAARKAIALDRGLAEAHTALGFVKLYEWEWDAAEREFKHAIELNPNYAGAYEQYSRYLVAQGREEEAIAGANRALELDPLSLNIRTLRGQVLLNARRFDEAIEQLRRVIELDQNHYLAFWFLGHAYAANGQFERAIESAGEAVALSGRAPAALGVLGMAYGLAGRKAEARKVLNELLKLSRHRYVTPGALVYAHIGLGDKDQAFVWMEKAFHERSYFIAFLKVVPVVDSLRSDARLKDLLRRIGLEP